MNTKKSAIIASVVGLTTWVGVSSSDLIAQAEPGPRQTAAVALPRPSAPTDAERRAELGRRIDAMLAEGKGRRLEDAPRVAASRQPTRRPNAPTTQRQPAMSPQPARLGMEKGFGRSAYRAPKLDLISTPVIPSSPLECLTQALYYEARNESEEGQAAVAEVVINRANSGRYPRDICQVVYQRNSQTCQFTFTCDGSIGRSAINASAWARAERIARSVYAGESKALLPLNSVNYHANYVRPSWSRRLERVRRIGAHIFYGSPTQGGTPGEQAPPSRQNELIFVKNDAIERAYELFSGRRDSQDSR